MSSKFPRANPPYEVKYNEKAWFNPWCVVEVRIEGIGYKHYKKIDAFSNNADALILCDKLNGKDHKPKPFKPIGGGFYK